jgi:hypothetical protein
MGISTSPSRCMKISCSPFEEPRTEINVKRDLTKQSATIEAWSAVDPESHFMRKEGQQGNFFFIPALIAMG